MCVCVFVWCVYVCVCMCVCGVCVQCMCVCGVCVCVPLEYCTCLPVCLLGSSRGIWDVKGNGVKIIGLVEMKREKEKREKDITSAEK